MKKNDSKRKHILGSKLRTILPMLGMISISQIPIDASGLNKNTEMGRVQTENQTLNLVNQSETSQNENRFNLKSIPSLKDDKVSIARKGCFGCDGGCSGYCNGACTGRCAQSCSGSCSGSCSSQSTF